MKCNKECVYSENNICTDRNTEKLCEFTERRRREEKEKTNWMVKKAHAIRKTNKIKRLVAQAKQYIKDYEEKVHEAYRYDANIIAVEQLKLRGAEKYAVLLELVK